MDQSEYMRALDAVVVAAMALSDKFSHTGEVNGYPPCLPSWDEFVIMLIDWNNAEKEARGLMEVSDDR